ncbi:hypothetical protein OZ10_17755 [Xanthomonas cannabis pv. cannabis]|nr:hypothetical protein OZ10_17755 [Xanthomonas cannabis pv. cannabis]
MDAKILVCKQGFFEVSYELLLIGLEMLRQSLSTIDPHQSPMGPTGLTTRASTVDQIQSQR